MDKCKSCTEIEELESTKEVFENIERLTGSGSVASSLCSLARDIKHLKDFHPCTCKKEVKFDAFVVEGLTLK